MNDPIEELRERIRVLEEAIDALRTGERQRAEELRDLGEAHNKLVRAHDNLFDDIARWSTEHEGRHREIDDHLYPAFFKLFPQYEGFWKEVDATIERKPEAAPPEPTAPEEPAAEPDADDTHDKWCTCAACGARDGERIARENAAHIAETGHPKSCMCEPCNTLRSERHKREAAENAQRMGYDPEDKPPPDYSYRERNPFSDPQSFQADHKGPAGPPVRKPSKAHEPFCACVDCQRWRGTGGKRGSSSFFDT